MKRKVLSMLLVIVLLVSIFPQAGLTASAKDLPGFFSRQGFGLTNSFETGRLSLNAAAEEDSDDPAAADYDAVFLSDLHNGLGGYLGLKQMMAELKGEQLDPKVLSHGGDYVEDSRGGDVNWQTQVYDVISGTEKAAFPDAIQAYTMGNHDWETGTFGGRSDKEKAFKEIFGFERTGLAYSDTELEIYMIGSQCVTNSGGGGEAFEEADIAAFDRYLASKVGSGKVIFLQTHWPAHSSYNFRQRVTTNSDKMIDTVNKYADEMDIVWIWGHNHYEDTMRYEIKLPGDKIIYAADTSGSSWGNPRNPRYKTIDFIYANAGCMNDMWWKGDNHNDTNAANNFRGPSACLSVAVEDAQITFTYNRIKPEDDDWVFSHDADITIHDTLFQHPSTVVVNRKTPDHTHEFEFFQSVEPTCTEEGYTVEKCIYCDRTRSVDFVPALGHAWGEGVVTTAPTANREGVMTYTCTRCGETRTESIPRLSLEIDALEAAIARAEAIDPNLYTEESVAALNGALTAAKTALDAAVTQTEIDDAADALNAALDALEEKPPVEGPFVLVNKPLPGKSYVIVADGQFALNNSDVKYGSYSSGSTTLGSTAVTVSDGSITSNVYEGMLWTFRAAEGVRDAIDGRDQYFFFNQTGSQLLRRSGSTATAPLSLGTMDEAKPQYATFSLYQREDGSYTMYVNSYSNSDYPFTLRGNAQGFNCPGESRDSWEKEIETYGSSIRFYGKADEVCSHDYQAVVTAPTCTETGYTTYTCSLCGERYTGDETPALGHDYQAVVTAPTCTETGYTTYTCTRCGDTYVADETPALGHDYQAVVTAPTCTETGYTTYTCTRCGDTYVADETPALGHDYQAAVTAPTCTEAGYTTYTCARCGHSYQDDTVPAAGHKFTAKVDPAYLISEATIASPAIYCYSCAVCGAKDESHTFTYGDPLPDPGGLTLVTVAWSWNTTAQNPSATLRLMWSDGHVDTYPATVSLLTQTAEEATYQASADVIGTHFETEKTVKRSYRVEVRNGTVISGKKSSYSYGDQIIVRASAAPTGKAFSGWYIGETLMCTSETYSRRVVGDTVLEARFAEEQIAPTPTLSVTDTARTYTASTGKYKTTLRLEWSLPSGYTLVQAGIFRAYSQSPMTAEAIAAANLVSKSTLKNSSGSFNVSVTMSAAKRDFDLYYVGYVTYTDAEGNQKTVYSEIGCNQKT